MPLFSYKAIDAQGKAVVGRLEAINLFDLEQRLQRMELDLVGGALASDMARLFGGGRVTRQDLINFCFHLEQLATAGVPLVEGLTDLRDSLENPRFREVVSGLIESIHDAGRWDHSVVIVASAVLAGYVGFQYVQKQKALEFGVAYARSQNLQNPVVSAHPRPVSHIGDSPWTTRVPRGT